MLMPVSTTSATPACDQRSHLATMARQAAPSAGTPRAYGHDAVRAERVAAVLDLDHRPGCGSRSPGARGTRSRHADSARVRWRRSSRDAAATRALSGSTTTRVAEGLEAPRGRAPRDSLSRPRPGSADRERVAHRLSGLRVRLTGHRAGVDDDDVGGVLGHEPRTRAKQLDAICSLSTWFTLQPSVRRSHASSARSRCRVGVSRHVGIRAQARSQAARARDHAASVIAASAAVSARRIVRPERAHGPRRLDEQRRPPPASVRPRDRPRARRAVRGTSSHPDRERRIAPERVDSPGPSDSSHSTSTTSNSAQRRHGIARARRGAVDRRESAPAATAWRRLRRCVASAPRASRPSRHRASRPCAR